MGQFVETVLLLACYFLWIITLPVSLFFTYRLVKLYEQIIIFRFGRLRQETSSPGLVFHLPCIDTVIVSDTRIGSYGFYNHEVLSKDHLPLTVDGFFFYRVDNLKTAFMKAKNFSLGMYSFAQAAVTTTIAQLGYQEVIRHRNVVFSLLNRFLMEHLENWGIEVVYINLNRFSLPEELQRSMALETEATVLASAVVWSARGELDSASVLRKASDIITSNRNTFQLKIFQTLTAVARERRVQVFFPIYISMAPVMQSPSELDKDREKSYFELPLER